MKLNKLLILPIFILGLMTVFSSCELNELVGIEADIPEFSEETDLKISAPDPATVIKKIISDDCVGSSAQRIFNVYITPDAFAYYCGGGNSLSYRFTLVSGANISTILYTSNDQMTSFNLPGGTKYTLELYTPGNTLVSTPYSFQLEDCLSEFVSGTSNLTE